MKLINKKIELENNKFIFVYKLDNYYDFEIFEYTEYLKEQNIIDLSPRTFGDFLIEDSIINNYSELAQALQFQDPIPNLIELGFTTKTNLIKIKKILNKLNQEQEKYKLKINKLKEEL